MTMSAEKLNEKKKESMDCVEAQQIPIQSHKFYQDPF